MLFGFAAPGTNFKILFIFVATITFLQKLSFVVNL
jgi:hypothetical protein